MAFVVGFSEEPLQMARKEKYFTRENLAQEVLDIQEDIRKTGYRERECYLNGKPALLVTDMQEYFLSPDSHAFIPSAGAIIPNITHLINVFQQKQYPVIFTQHYNNEGDAGMMKTWWNDLINVESPFFSLSPLLPYSPSENILLKKTQYDAFHDTNLEKILKDNSIITLIICGVMANLCCESTLRAAFLRNYLAIIPVDATATYNRHFHISTFVNLSFGFCPVKTTSEILEVINK
jgi:isochorismate hydrolase